MMLVPGVLLVLWTFARLDRPSLTSADYRAGLCAGLVGPFGKVAIVSDGIILSTAFSTSLLVACGPVFTLLIRHLLGTECPKRSQVVGVAIAFCGIPVCFWDKLPQPIWLDFFYVVLVVTLAGQVAWAWGNGLRGVARSAPLHYLIPVAGLVAWRASGETFSAPKLDRAVIAMSGVALA